MTEYKPQTILEELLVKYPDKPWNWVYISKKSKYYCRNLRSISR